MARINVEEDLFSDPRLDKLTELCGKRAEAIGTLVLIWREAQKHYLRNQDIPFEIWDVLPNANHVVTAGLAIRRSGGVYIKGSEEKFDWIKKNRENGKKGGRRPKKQENKDLEKPVANPSPSECQPVAKPLTPPLPLPPPLKESKSLNKKVNKTHTSEFLFDFESLYKTYPRKEGKADGLAVCVRTIKTQDDYDSLKLAIENYKSHVSKSETEPRYVKHFSTFMMKERWKEWINPEQSSTGHPSKLEYNNDYLKNNPEPFF